MKLKFIPMAVAITAIIATTATAANAQKLLRHDDKRGASTIERFHKDERWGSNRHLRQRSERSYQALAPQQIVRSLHNRGYQNIHITGVHRGYYKVEASGYRGPVLLTVNGSNAEIVNRQRLQQRHSYRYERDRRSHRNEFRGGSIVFHFGG